MPTDPNHLYVDTPHPKTVVDGAWRYGCNSLTIGPGPRGRTRKTRVQAGWRTVIDHPVGPVTRQPIMVESETKWNPEVACGYIQATGQQSDPACAGCENRQW